MTALASCALPGVYAPVPIGEVPAEFTAALDGDPNNMDALLNLAALELAYGNFESALKHFDQALKIRPRDAGVVLSRGVAFFACQAVRGHEQLKVS